MGALLLARSRSRPAGPAAVLFDDFNRANGALGNATTGQPWTVHAGTAVIASNQASLTGSEPRATVDSGIANGSVEAKVPGISNLMLLFRWSGTTNYWAIRTSGSSGAEIRKIVSGTTTVAASTSSLTIAAGDVFKVILLGSSITFQQNGITRLTATDAFNSTATRVGFGTNATSGTYLFDDLQVSA